MTITSIKDCIRKNRTQIFIPVLGTFRFYGINDEFEFWENVYDTIYKSGKEAGRAEKQEEIKKVLGI